MKIHLTFNHEEKDSLKAIDCQYNGEQVNERIFRMLKNYINNNEFKRASQLSELMHQELSYEEILFLATHSLQDKIVQMGNHMMMDAMKDLLSELEDDE
jgi:hypothetical protein